MPPLLLLLILLSACASISSVKVWTKPGVTSIGISGDYFTVNKTKMFLLGVSYFDAMGWKVSDLDGLASRNFNLIRIFLDWPPETWDSTVVPRSRSFFNNDGSMKNTETLLNLVRG